MCAALLKKNSKDGVFQKCNALYTKNPLNDGVFQGYCAISTKKSSDYGALQDLQKEKGKDREGYQPAIIARNSTTNNPQKQREGTAQTVFSVNTVTLFKFLMFIRLLFAVPASYLDPREYIGRRYLLTAALVPEAEPVVLRRPQRTQKMSAEPVVPAVRRRP